MDNKTCINLKVCKQKHIRWRRNQEFFIPIGEREHELFLDNFKNNRAEFKLSNHFNKRSLERSISKRDLNEVLSYGWVIERTITSVQDVLLIILGYTSGKRSLHVVANVIDNDFWTIVTGYSPASQKHKWSKDYQQRICFCKHEY